MIPNITDTPLKGAARCPRFETCNAPLCPLDDWQRAQHLQGEAVCSLLSELVKDGGDARLRAFLPSVLVDTLADVFPKITARWERVRSQLKRASRTGSKLEAVRRLHGLKSGAHPVSKNRRAAALSLHTALPATHALNDSSSAIGGANGRR